jgi:hypothetical protein
MDAILHLRARNQDTTLISFLDDSKHNALLWWGKGEYTGFKISTKHTIKHKVR